MRRLKLHLVLMRISSQNSLSLRQRFQTVCFPPNPPAGATGAAKSPDWRPRPQQRQAECWHGIELPALWPTRSGPEPAEALQLPIQETTQGPWAAFQPTKVCGAGHVSPASISPCCHYSTDASATNGMSCAQIFSNAFSQIRWAHANN